MTLMWSITVVSMLVFSVPHPTVFPSLTQSLPSAPPTEETLSTSLQTLNHNILNLSQTLQTNDQIQLQSLTELQGISHETVHGLVSTMLEEKEDELKRVNEDIEELEGRVYSAETECGQWESCGGCTGSADCVWCEVERRCAVGGSSGPLGGSCQLYRYKECPLPECRNAQSCAACIVLDCTWCQNGQICLEKDTENSLCERNLKVNSVNQCKITEIKEKKTEIRYIPPEISLNFKPGQVIDDYRTLNQLKNTRKMLENAVEKLRKNLEKVDGNEILKLKTAEIEDISDFLTSPHTPSFLPAP